MILDPKNLNKLFTSSTIQQIKPQITYSFSLFSPHVSTFTKDLATSSLKSLLFLRIKPFKIKDSIKLLGYEGRVENVDLFYVTIRKKDKNVVCIPTCNMLNTIIEIIK